MSPSTAATSPTSIDWQSILARQKPAWPPGTRQAYHALSLGFYQGELLRRVDPRHRSLGQFFQDEIASPLGTGRLHPPARAHPQLPPRDHGSARRLEMLLRFPLSLTLDAMNRHSNIYRALEVNPGRACISIGSASTPATSKCRRAAPSARPAASRARTVSSPRADGSWDCARRRWICWRRPRSLRHAAFMTNA